MNADLVLVRDEGPVRWLTLNRPDQRNALGPDLVERLGAALAEAASSGARCVAIAGAGPAFSAGADLKALRDLRDRSFEENVADSRNLAALFQAVAEHPLPVIAAVNGHAIAGGAGLAVACDIAIMAEGAKMGFTEVRVGFVPAIILNFLLRAAGEKFVRDVCLTGRLFEADEAARLGFVNRAAPAADLPGLVADFGKRVAAAGPAAVAATKRLILELRSRPLGEGLDLAASANARARGTPDCREGIDAFLEKREPNWTKDPRS